MSFTGNKWSERLNDLAAIEDGWYEGHGKALTFEALSKAEEILTMLDSPNFHVPGIYPLVDEGVLAMEWSAAGHSCLVSLQFTEDFTYEVFSMDSKGHPDDDILVETKSLEDAMKLLRECLTKSKLLTVCETRD